MSVPRKHHFAPTFYLAGFTAEGERDGQLYVCDLHTGSQYPSSPTKAGSEQDFYAVMSKDRQAALVEKWLAEFIDGPGARALSKTIESREVPDRDDPDFEWLMGFVASMVVRGQFFRSRVNDFNDRIIKAAMWHVAHDERAFSNFFRDATDNTKADQRFNPQKMREFLKSEEYTVSLDQTTLISSMLEMLPPLMAMMIKRHWTLLKADEQGPLFVTSDFPVPCIATRHTGLFGPGYGMANTMVFFPLTRQHALVGTFEERQQPTQCGPGRVAIVNAHVALSAHRFVYSATKGLQWLDNEGQIRGTDDLLAHNTDADP